MRKSIIAASLLSAFVTVPAFAQEAPKEPYTFTANVSLASEYTYRGIGQTNRKPAIQGGFDFAHESGVYVGTWASNVSWLSDQGSAGATPISNSMEWDFYGGYKMTAGPIGLDFGVLTYYYPGTYPNGFTSPNTTELYAAASWEWLTFKYSYALTNLFGAKTPDGGDTNGSAYYDLTASVPVGAGFNVIGHVGYQDVKDFSDASYTDWKLGVTKDFVGVSWGLSYIGTNAKGDEGQFYRNAHGKDLGKDRIVLTATKTF
ncbi:MAG: TorF family putative porin [Rhodocyclaceae bacterium]